MKKTLLTLALVGLSAAAPYAQGTIQFLNSTLNRVLYQDTVGGPVVNAPTGTKIGVFWGADSAGGAGIEGMGKGTLVTPTSAIGTTAGIWAGGPVYPIAGTTEGTRIWLKIAGWDGNVGDNFANSAHYGESAAVNILLGPTSGPGTVVWQGATGTATDRAKPFTIAPVVPEPSVIALGALGLGALLLRRRKA